ncbi:hypothetical protein FACS189487_03710 [Campylobacterota bacterium]|nr:hypothetical protein FACS189487_03710 [Campylobacterota bacterium]
MVMTPKSIQQEMELFSRAPFSKKTFIVVQSSDPNRLIATSKDVAAALKKFDGFRAAAEIDKSFFISYFYYLPNIWDEELESQIEASLANAQQRIENSAISLTGFESIFAQDIIVADPLSFLEIAAKRLRNLNITDGSMDFKEGFLVSEDGKTAILIYEALEDSLDIRSASKIVNDISQINAALPQDTRIFVMGSARYTQENNDVIKKDVSVVLAISLIALSIIFFLFFRDKAVLFIYIVPMAILIPSAVCTFLFFGELSGITIGFGSVLMGLAIDYTIYIYFAMRVSSATISPTKAARAMLRPVALSAVTSILTFAALYFSYIPFLQQISVFATFGLVCALLIAFIVAPLLFKQRGITEKEFIVSIKISRSLAVVVIVLTIILGLFSTRYITVDSSLDSLNTVSQEFLQDRAIFDKAVGALAVQSGLLFIFGNDQDEALRKSETFAFDNNISLTLSNVLVSQKRAAKNQERWHRFWSDERIFTLKHTFQNSIGKYGLDIEIFDEFFQFLYTANPPLNIPHFELQTIYNPFITYGDRTAVAHIVKETFTSQSDEDIVLLSQDTIQHDLFLAVLEKLFLIITIVLVINCIVVFFFLKNIKLALLTFIPLLCSFAALAIIAAIFSIHINLFSLFAIPLIMGLGVDYAIFVIYQQITTGVLHPPKALLCAYLTSLTGFGSLIFASHKVLFAIGFTVAIGITVVVLVSALLLPPLIKESER